MTKSPVAPKAGVQPCEGAVIADPPSLGSQAFGLPLPQSAAASMERKGQKHGCHGSSPSGVLKANLGKDAHKIVPCDSLSQSCRSHSKDGRGILVQIHTNGLH